MVCLEEDHEHLVTNEAKEFRQEMAKLQNKIMEDAVSSVHLILRNKEGCQH